MVYPWLSGDAGRPQCYQCYVDLIGDFFYHGMQFPPWSDESLFQSAGVKRHLYYITRTFGFTESYNSAMSSIQGLVAKAKDFINNRIRLEGSFANMRVSRVGRGVLQFGP